VIPATVPDLSPSAVKFVIEPGLGVVGVVAIIVGLVRNRPAHRLPWVFFALGLGAYASAEIGFYLYTEVLTGNAPFAQWTDLFYFTAYLLISAGVLLIIRHRTPGRDSSSVVDALILTTGYALVSWVFLMEPYAGDPSLTLLERLTALTYPALGILLLAVTARLAIGAGVRRPAHWILLVCFSSVLIGDTTFAFQELGDGFHTGGLIDIAWMVFFSGFGAAALHPSMRLVSQQTPLPPVNITTRRLVLLATASLMAPGVLAYESYQRQPIDAPVIAAASVVLFLLVIVRMAGLIKILRQQASELDRLARIDALTGVPNRRAWDEALGAELARAARHGEAPYVAMIDIDHFKVFNDTYGHLAGDRLLREAAGAWRAELRIGDVLARYGGEEFAVLLTECVSEQDAIEVVERMLTVTPLGQSFSAGVARWEGTESPEELVARADDMLYVVKRTGRGRCLAALAPTDTAQAVAAGTTP